MYREILKPTTQKYTLNIPKEYLNQEIEIVVLPISEKKKNINEESELKALSNHSANLVQEWKDESEDEVWK